MAEGGEAGRETGEANQALHGPLHRGGVLSISSECSCSDEAFRVQGEGNT